MLKGSSGSGPVPSLSGPALGRFARSRVLRSTALSPPPLPMARPIAFLSIRTGRCQKLS